MQIVFYSQLSPHTQFRGKNKKRESRNWESFSLKVYKICRCFKLHKIKLVVLNAASFLCQHVSKIAIVDFETQIRF